jgi:glycine/D-amino acid oxidase-like deaminating enzyme
MADPLPDHVLVIGAGVHGLSAAWHLAEQGQKVLVVTRPASPPARRESRAARFATTASSRRCPS